MCIIFRRNNCKSNNTHANGFPTMRIIKWVNLVPRHVHLKSKYFSKHFSLQDIFKFNLIHYHTSQAKAQI